MTNILKCQLKKDIISKKLNPRNFYLPSCTNIFTKPLAFTRNLVEFFTQLRENRYRNDALHSLSQIFSKLNRIYLIKGNIINIKEKRAILLNYFKYPPKMPISLTPNIDNLHIKYFNSYLSFNANNILLYNFLLENNGIISRKFIETFCNDIACSILLANKVKYDAWSVIKRIYCTCPYKCNILSKIPKHNNINVLAFSRIEEHQFIDKLEHKMLLNLKTISLRFDKDPIDINIKYIMAHLINFKGLACIKINVYVCSKCDKFHKDHYGHKCTEFYYLSFNKCSTN